VAYPKRPTLQEETDGYVLYIHPRDRFRAKGIGQYRFDPRRSGWVYPKDSRILDALIAEFGDELDMSHVGIAEIAHPKTQREVNSAFTAATKKSLKAGMETPQAIGIEDYVELRVKLEKLEAELQTAISDRDAAQETARQVQEALETRNANESLDHFVKAVAAEATMNDVEFTLLLEHIEIRDMPIALARQLEEECRKLLRVNDERTSFADLLADISDSNMLPRDAIDLAHIIRKQRNIVAHEERARGQKTARAVLTLMAASLLWPELKRSQADLGS